MAIFKCKMCGGTIEFQDGATVGVCDSCGTKQTLPRLDSDRKTNLYDRANHFRRNNEFDKAMSIYENILNEDPTDAEAYWSIVLCRYGIEYVEDPATHRRVPTVNRAQFTSIFDDEDYKSALKNADALQRTIYEDEAKAINEIQKGILEISSKEEPFDVFICYKETDANGRRTPDSVLATDLYHQLTNEGFKVFFSRITLEDKLGQEYEPYIFAALNSAKAMVVLGTRPEHFNAVWVKNEWSRYLALIKAGAKKTLIPAYRDMDPYDLPDEFSHLQAQDMSKLGFMQDLIRGIKKLVKTDEPKQTIRETIVTPAPTAATAPLLRRAFMFLEDGEWQSANEYCEKVLDVEPENAEAYLGKLMAELKVNKRDALKDQPEPFDNRNNYKKAYRFGDNALKTKLKDDITFIRERNELARREEIYRQAIEKRNNKRYQDAIELFGRISGFKDADKCKAECENEMETDRKNTIYDTAIALAQYDTIQRQQEAIGKLRQIPGWKDADAQIGLCEQRIETIKINTENARKDGIYQEAIALMNEDGTTLRGAVGVTKKSPIERHKAAIELLRSIPGWRDTDDRILACQQRIEEIKAKEEADRLERERQAEERRIAAEKAAKKRKRTFAIVTPILVACIAFVIVLTTVIIPNQKYNAAVELYNAGKYEEAIAAFTALDGYKDSAAQIEKCETAIKDEKYASAVELYTAGKYEEAIAAFETLNGYKDSNEQIESCKIKKYGEANYQLVKSLRVGDTFTFGLYEQDNSDSNGKEPIEWIVLERNGNRIFAVSKYVIECRPYHSLDAAVTWETSELRAWLNDEFYNAAFSNNEKRTIAHTIVKADKHMRFATDPGNDTEDKVFVLSLEEANTYSDSVQSLPTAYVKNNFTYLHVLLKDGYDYCAYWFRTPGMYPNFAADSSSPLSNGYNVNNNTLGVRPALWIDFDREEE